MDNIHEQLKIIKEAIIKIEGLLDCSEHIKEFEESYLSIGNTRILIVIPTEKQLDSVPNNLLKLLTPTGCQVKYFNVHGLPVSEAYNAAAKICLDDNADYMLTIEDDTYPPNDGLIKLLNVLRTRKEISAVGGWYPKKNIATEGVHIILTDWTKDKKYRSELRRDAEGLVEVYTLAMGFSLYRGEMFKYISDPRFVTTDNLTQDSFFSEKARKMGYKLYCDMDVKCKHIDRTTGEVYE